MPAGRAGCCKLGRAVEVPLPAKSALAGTSRQPARRASRVTLAGRGAAGRVLSGCWAGAGRVQMGRTDGIPGEESLAAELWDMAALNAAFRRWVCLFFFSGFFGLVSRYSQGLSAYW